MNKMVRLKFIKVAGFCAAVSFLIFQPACYYPDTSPGWEYMPDMVHSIAYETYSPNPNFSDSTSARTPVTGTIPRGIYMPFHYSNTPAGYDSAGEFLHFPQWITDSDRLEGERLFSIYCAVCHGSGGHGNGSIVANPKLKNPFPPPPPYFDANHIGLPEGKMYFSAHYGKNLMGPYSKSLDQVQLWEIVSYVKSLQLHYIDSVHAAGHKVLGLDSAIVAAATTSATTTSTPPASTNKEPVTKK